MRREGSQVGAHPRTRLILVLFAITAAFVAAGTSGAAYYRPHEVKAQPHVPGELIVRFAPGLSGRERADVVGKHAAKVKKALPLSGLAVVEVDPKKPVRQAADELAREPGVLHATPNFRRKLAARTPNDPRFSELWGLTKISAPTAWDTTTGSAEVAVAVVDTGIAHNHPDLDGNIWRNADEVAANGVDDDGNGYVDDIRGWDFVAEDRNPADQSGHGTHVAGTIGAEGNNGVGVTGVNWTVSLMALRAGDDFGLADEDIIEAFTYACRNGAKVVNGSFGGGPDSFSQPLLDSIRSCPSALFVFAAGNEGNDNDDSASYPCNFELANIVCVAASNSADELPDWSNYGATSVDLAAPGASILSTSAARIRFEESFDGPALTGWATGGTGSWSQTSEAFASPPKSVTESPGGLHAENANTWLRRTAATDLTGYSNCGLEFVMKSDLDWYDGVMIEVGDDQTWNDFDDRWIWTGGTGGEFEWWREDISDFDRSPSVYLGFEFISGTDYEPLDGVHLDDVSIRCYAGPGTPGGYESWDGTSMATPHVAGAAALVWAHRPGASVAEVRAALLDGADAVPALAGKVATGGRLNVARALGVTTPPAEIPVADFDGDGDTDFSVWRPENGTWYGFGGLTQPWGHSSDVPVPGQYDGDAAIDVAVWRPSSGTWYVHGGATQQWGVSTDVPVPGDYDGDGDTEFAVWRPSSGTWYVQGGTTQPWGVSSDVPVPADYDGDGDTDIAVWRPSTGTWYIHGGATQAWGVSSDVPVPGQYDADPATEIAVWRPESGTWFVHGGTAQQWGVSTDVPVPGDYDGNGDTELAVWRPSSGTWFVQGGATQQWGVSGDKPLPPLPSVARLLHP